MTTRAAALVAVLAAAVAGCSSDPCARQSGTCVAVVIQGDVGDTDGHGGQQYGPLMDIEIP